MVQRYRLTCRKTQNFIFVFEMLVQANRQELLGPFYTQLNMKRFSWDSKRAKRSSFIYNAEEH